MRSLKRHKTPVLRLTDGVNVDLIVSVNSASEKTLHVQVEVIQVSPLLLLGTLWERLHVELRHVPAVLVSAEVPLEVQTSSSSSSRQTNKHSRTEQGGNYTGTLVQSFPRRTWANLMRFLW